jgi:hypothetical protein
VVRSGLTSDLSHIACLLVTWEKFPGVAETMNATKNDLEPFSLNGASRCACRGMEDDQEVPRTHEESWEWTRNRPEPTGFESSVTNFFSLPCPVRDSFREVPLLFSKTDGLGPNTRNTVSLLNTSRQSSIVW